MHSEGVGEGTGKSKTSPVSFLWFFVDRRPLRKRDSRISWLIMVHSEGQ